MGEVDREELAEIIQAARDRVAEGQRGRCMDVIVSMMEQCCELQDEANEHRREADLMDAKLRELEEQLDDMQQGDALTITELGWGAPAKKGPG